jgi:hypothetical protein
MVNNRELEYVLKVLLLTSKPPRPNPPSRHSLVWKGFSKPLFVYGRGFEGVYSILYDLTNILLGVTSQEAKITQFVPDLLKYATTDIIAGYV